MVTKFSVVADTKLKEMKQELDKSQDLAEKYRFLYETERRKHLKEGEILPPMPEELLESKPPASYSFLGQGIRVNDVIRKNEVILSHVVRRPVFGVYIQVRSKLGCMDTGGWLKAGNLD